MAKSRAVWGIDIGQCALKALRCQIGADGEVVADHYDYIEYPKILSQADADPEELVRDALQEFLSRNEVKKDSVAISVSGQAGLSRFFKPPPVDVKTLPEIVKFEVKQQIPFPIEDVIWDWQQLGGSIIDGRTVDAEVGLFAMKREAVFRALRPFDDADVDVDFVQLSPLSIFNVVCHDIIEELPDPEEFDPENPPESMVVMSMGTDTTDLIVSNGIKLWLRNIPIGGNHFTKQLSRELKLTQAKAEHLKRNARQAENPKAVFKAMRPVFNDLVNEVQRSLTFFQSMEKSAGISKLVLLGNAAKLPGLRQYLNKQLELDIAKVTEFKNLSGSDVVGQKSFTDNLLSFAPCYGLCLQGLKKGHVKTNLLPQEIVVERIIRAKKPWVLASVGALMLGCMLGYFFKETAWWRVNDNYRADGTTWKEAKSKVTSEASTSANFVSKDEEQKDRLDKLTRLSQELKASSKAKSTWIEMLSALSQALPRDAAIREMAEGNDFPRIDPKSLDFKNREEIYIDHIESKYVKDLGEWQTSVQPNHDLMLANFLEDLRQSEEDTEDAEKATEKGEDEKSALDKQAGWVIELRAHHFHNGVEFMADSDRAYVLRTMISKLLNGEVQMPTAGGVPEMFKFSDFGLYYPTLVAEAEPTPSQVVFYFEQNQSSQTPTGDAEEETPAEKSGPLVSNVNRYDFIIQMAWIPRSPIERDELKQVRVEAELAAAEKAAEAAANEQNNN